MSKLNPIPTGPEMQSHWLSNRPAALPEAAPRPFPDPEHPDLVRARYILNRAEVRKFVVDGTIILGILVRSGQS
jgi:hypothetical protein